LTSDLEEREHEDNSDQLYVNQHCEECLLGGFAEVEALIVRLITNIKEKLLSLDVNLLRLNVLTLIPAKEKGVHLTMFQRRTFDNL
jgi:hypothetical protein